MIGVLGFRTESPKAALHEGQEPANNCRSEPVESKVDSSQSNVSVSLGATRLRKNIIWRAV